MNYTEFIDINKYMLFRSNRSPVQYDATRILPFMSFQVNLLLVQIIFHLTQILWKILIIWTAFALISKNYPDAVIYVLAGWMILTVIT